MTELEMRRQQLRTLTETLILAYGRKDFEVFARNIAADAVFDWPFLPLKEFPDHVRGRDRFIEISRAGMADCEGYNHAIDQLYDMADADLILAEYHTDAILGSGKHYSNKYLGILRFEGNQVVWWREYVNPLPIIEAYGLDFTNGAVSQ